MLGPLLEQEREYGAALMHTYKGFDVTEHTFFEIIIETLHLARGGDPWALRYQSAKSGSNMHSKD